MSHLHASKIARIIEKKPKNHIDMAIGITNPTHPKISTGIPCTTRKMGNHFSVDLQNLEPKKLVESMPSSNQRVQVLNLY